MQNIQQPQQTPIDWWTIAIVGGSWCGIMLLMFSTMGVFSLMVGLVVSVLMLLAKFADIVNERYRIL